MPRNRLTRACSAGAARAIRFEGASARPGMSRPDAAIPPGVTLRVLVTVTACLLVSSTASGARQLVLTERDSGKTYTVRRGRVLTLRLSSTYRWVEPKVKGRAITLTPVEYFTDPGFQEWQLNTVAFGRARITATGVAQSCSAEPCAQKRFRVVVVVRPRRS